MKLGYILGEFPSTSETFILREMLALRKQGAALRVFALRRPANAVTHPGADAFLDQVVYRPRGPGFSALLRARAAFGHGACRGALLSAVRQNARNPLNLARALRHFPAILCFAAEAKRAGIRHLHAHFDYVPAEIAMAAARLMGGTFSFTAHAWDIYTQSPGAHLRRMREAAFIVTCTGHGRHHLRGLYPSIPEEKFHLVRHSAPAWPDTPGPAADGVPPRLLAVGRLVPKKGFRILIDACRVLAERAIPFQLTIVGEGPQRAALERRIAEYSLERKVELRGQLRQDEVSRLQRDAACLVQPSLVLDNGDRDGLPNAVVESLGAGVPVVASRVGAMAELVTDGETGLLVPARDVMALADAIAHMLCDDAMRHRLGEAGRQRVAAEFNPDINARQLLALFAPYAGEVA